jgi:large subunit ribosomal protein L16
MQQPKRTKYRKSQTGVQKGIATSGFMMAHGSFGLKAMSSGFLTAREIEAARKTIAHALHRGGKVWIRVFAHKDFTKKALEVPMGWGKWGVEYYHSPIPAGTIIFEIEGVSDTMARTAFTLAGQKLSVKTSIVDKTSLFFLAA